jgi:hypothetical protein
MLRLIDWPVVTDVSQESSSSILRVKHYKYGSCFSVRISNIMLSYYSLLLDIEYGNTTLLRNVANYLLIHMA